MPHALVLVVDDDHDITEFIKTALEDEGYDVAIAVGGASLPLARDLQPTVILLDIMMPEMDGIEVSRRLREDERTKNIPIIAMSAHGNLRDKALTMPVDDQLPKPFDLSHLYSKIERWTPPWSAERTVRSR